MEWLNRCSYCLTVLVDCSNICFLIKIDQVVIEGNHVPSKMPIEPLISLLDLCCFYYEISTKRNSLDCPSCNYMDLFISFQGLYIVLVHII